MKYFYLFCTTVMFFYSCTRSNSTPNPPSPPVTADSIWVVTTVVTDEQIYAPFKTTYTYGADGRLTGESDTTKFDTTSYVYSYNGSTIYINSTRGAKDTVELNSRGYVTKRVSNSDASGNYINTDDYTYTGDTVLANWKFRQTSSSITFDVNFTFENGDMVSSIGTDRGNATNVTYYQDMPVVDPELYTDILAPSFPGAFIIRNKHLVKSVSNSYQPPTNYSYTLDSNGRVLVETATMGTATTTYTMTYAHIPVTKN